MTKYHINKKGVPSLCRATNGNCPFGESSQHFNTREEAQEHIEKVEKEKNGILPGIGTDNRSEEDRKVATELVNKAFSGNFSEINGHPQKYSKDQLKDLVEKMRSMRDKDGNVTEHLKKVESEVEEKKKNYALEVDKLKKNLTVNSDSGIELKELEEGIARNEEFLDESNANYRRKTGKHRTQQETYFAHKREVNELVNMRDRKKIVEKEFNKMIQDQTGHMKKEINTLENEYKLVRTMDTARRRPATEENPDRVTETERYYRFLENEG